MLLDLGLKMYKTLDNKENNSLAFVFPGTLAFCCIGE